jgi:hypothetical protein
VLPLLTEREPDLARRAAGLAEAALQASAVLDRALRRRLEPRPEPPDGGSRLSVALASLRALPASVLPFALAAMHRWAGSPYPPSGASCRELARQLAAGRGVGGDCGGGWRWRARRGRLHLAPPAPPRAPSRILCVSGAGSPPSRPSGAQRTDRRTESESSRW